VPGNPGTPRLASEREMTSRIADIPAPATDTARPAVNPPLTIPPSCRMPLGDGCRAASWIDGSSLLRCHVVSFLRWSTTGTVKTNFGRFTLNGKLRFLNPAAVRHVVG
jgi:hypothetical protein